MDTSQGSQQPEQQTTQPPSGQSGGPDSASGTPSGTQPKAEPRTEAERKEAVEGILSEALGMPSGTPPAGAGEAQSEREDQTAPEGPGDGEEGILAKPLGDDPEKLYSAKVNVGDGKTMTVGELKDAWTSQRQQVAEIARQTAELQTREVAISGKMQLATELAGYMGENLPASIREKLAQHMAQQDQFERRMALEKMPELADPTKYEATRKAITGVLQPYGFTETDVAQIKDHRIIQFLKHTADKLKQLDRLMAFEPAATPPRAAQSNGRGKATGSGAETAIRRAAQTGRETDRVAAVSALLKG